MGVPSLREHATAVSLEDVEISVTSLATCSINANTTHLNVRIFLYCLTLKGEVWSSCTFEDKNENISSTGLFLTETVKNIAKRYKIKCIRWPHIIKKKISIMFSLISLRKILVNTETD